jgi:hypothetical protein
MLHHFTPIQPLLLPLANRAFAAILSRLSAAPGSQNDPAIGFILTF